MDTAAIIAAITAVPATLAAIAAIISARRSGQTGSDMQQLVEKDRVMSQALVELIEKDEQIMRILMKHLRNRKAHYRG